MRLTFLVFLTLLSVERVFAQPQPTTPKVGPPKTGQRYFGMHFDFHATATDSLMGRGLSEQRLDSLLAAVRPDFIQIDCKGHPGVASFPSMVAGATVAKSFAKDPLAFYRTITRKHGVGLYVHYSGVQDFAVLAKHPTWSVVKADGKYDRANTSVHGPYVDSLMIPQLTEIADYGVDGAWIDGDCWATQLDYSPGALAKFRAESGIQTIPRSPKDPNYQVFKDFARTSFTRYMTHYLDELHRRRPGFRVTSNWSYSSMMPEPITTGVDYLSCDLTPGNSVNVATLEARILAPQAQLYKKPWDLMSWSFWHQYPPQISGDQKTAIHLMQDAAETIALGGGFQAYFYQNRDASIPLGELPVMVQLSRFVRARQAYCQGVTPIPQVAVLYSNTTFRRFSKPLFDRLETYRVQGVLSALLDAQMPAEVLAEHHLTGRMAQYPLIVVSQQDSLAPAFRQKLLDYARQGGNLMLIGATLTKQFATELGVTPIGDTTSVTKWIRYGNQATVVLNGAYQSVRVNSGTEPFGNLSASEYGEPSPNIIATRVKFGKGKLVGVYADLSRDYEKHQSSKLRDFLNALARPLLPNPVVTVAGSHLVHVVANKLNNQLAINLINTGGRHADFQVFTYDEVPPLSNLTVSIRTDRKPRRVVQQPENEVLPVQYANGITTVRVPTLAIHSILMVE